MKGRRKLWMALKRRKTPLNKKVYCNLTKAPMEISSGFFIFWEGMGRFGFGHFDGVYPPQAGSVTKPSGSRLPIGRFDRLNDPSLSLSLSKGHGASRSSHHCSFSAEGGSATRCAAFGGRGRKGRRKDRLIIILPPTFYPVLHLRHLLPKHKNKVPDSSLKHLFPHFAFLLRPKL